ncbi:hypothetical protein DDE18_01350 [Nocardioides gansuensis]|uniref:Peptidase C39-like domain-containing protein n=1 Tax=Nocardioides gansuensis TaxID=2138300 RepID=A0A2T8FF21_9ACTN|nr:hypothetical protein [Nocardioides gansuensis]PVG84306.1 hypothetical protein DDE18_01350 [Nocardioides gansuensis]
MLRSTAPRTAGLLRSRRRRAVAATLGALTLVVATAHLLPDRNGEGPALTPTGQPTDRPLPSGATGRGVVTPEMQAEIDRVVAAGLRQRVSPTASARSLATATARCATFDGQRYCLGVGWTTKTEQQVAARLASPAPSGRERTGDLDPVAAMQRLARMTPAARADAERAELTDAARSVAKVWLLRHEIQGVPLPADLAEEHPEAFGRPARAVQARDTTTAAATTPTPGTDPAAATAPAPVPAAAPAVKTPADYPQAFKILKDKHVRPQKEYYWCGPATMQMIAWGWRDRRQGQALWAERLHTTTAGTSITDMVRVVNNNTGFDRPEHAGSYVVLDIGDFTFDQWWLLMMKHVHDYQAPVVLHPVLLKRYFPYLDDDASGHFQVGRGFDQNPGGNPQLGYFEPWDQSRFDPSEPFIPRNQWRSAYKAYRANQAHFQHNLGV